LGGLIGMGDDAGFICRMYGFGLIRGMELNQEAGFRPIGLFDVANLIHAGRTQRVQVLQRVAVHHNQIRCKPRAHAAQLSSCPRILALFPVATAKPRAGVGAEGQEDGCGRASPPLKWVEYALACYRPAGKLKHTLHHMF
jgi:hypothetical protein